MSDDSRGSAICSEHPKQCQTCSGHACNNDSIAWGRPLSCLKCSSHDNENCRTAVDKIPSVECASIVLGYENHCFTHANQSHMQRGCLLEAQDEIQNSCYDSNDQSCLLCNKSNCNRDQIDIGEYCYECDSKVDTNCLGNVAPYMEKKCDSSRSGCYMIRINENINSES